MEIDKNIYQENLNKLTNVIEKVINSVIKNRNIKNILGKILMQKQQNLVFL